MFDLESGLSAMVSNDMGERDCSMVLLIRSVIHKVQKR